ncbi:hypothetical protein [Paenibacillus roseipurpureus]|uniref:Uncharacterized protein n=1 Tax=Paenibacillus roseopurpureus TaxID=2918901 RepID=A0AA96LT44_9BACL|nr:hypothetical protein [Paenibacillus sp. MBLB1832]WNR46823.1 hypothetical protein MJB10_12255 [Paenibacillus sp. MBLB1832]
MNNNNSTLILGMAKSSLDYHGAKEPKLRLDILQMIQLGQKCLENKLCSKVVCYMTMPYKISYRENKGKTKIISYDMDKFITEWAKKYNDNDQITVVPLFVDMLLKPNEKSVMLKEKDANVHGMQLTAINTNTSSARYSGKLIERKMKQVIKNEHNKVVFGKRFITEYNQIYEISNYVRWDFIGVLNN